MNGNYTLRLPFGVNYILGVNAKNFKTLDNKVDLTSFVEFVSLKQNLFAEREDANMEMCIRDSRISGTQNFRMTEPGAKPAGYPIR